ncbi:MAG: low molecular weight protein-tyrosine-phosphatase [Pseudomonadota bacterium]
MTSVLFVCLGNICRSPAAEGVFRDRAAAAGLDVTVDSAGTGAWHAGEPPDRRMIAAAARRRYDLSAQRARRVDDGDGYSFDYILAMDASNLSDLRDRALPDWTATVRMLHPGRDVPDPYYGGEQGFETVLDMLEEGVDALIDEIKSGA